MTDGSRTIGSRRALPIEPRSAFQPKGSADGAADDEAGGAAGLGDAGDRADVAGILHVDGDDEQARAAGARTPASACRGRAPTATTPDGVVAGLMAAITASETWTTRTPVPARLVASRRARPSAAASARGVKAALASGDLRGARLLDEMQAVEEQALRVAALADPPHEPDERVLAAGDHFHGAAVYVELRLEACGSRLEPARRLAGAGSVDLRAHEPKPQASEPQASSLSKPQALR